MRPKVPQSRAADQGRYDPVIASLAVSEPFSEEDYAASLAAVLGHEVEVDATRLPEPCICLWLGFTGVDRIWCNQDCPGRLAMLTAHAVGHLILGHCGTVRDGGQFACVLTGAQLSHGEREHLASRLHDATEGFSRLFSDREEHDAADFAVALRERLEIAHGHESGELAASATCVG
jgi:hypothetical protein